MTDPRWDADLHITDGDLVQRYLTGKLDPDQADRLEAHFFECDECWRFVRRALEIRAAFFERSGEGGGAPGNRPRWFRRGEAWWSMAAAALVVVALGTWRFAGELLFPDPAFRSVGGTMEVTIEGDATELTLHWPRVPETDLYQLRIFTPEGSLLLERETSDTSVVLSWVEVAGGAPGASLYGDVRALDALREIVARSGLQEIRPPRRE